MKRLLIIVAYPILFIIDVGIYLTIGGHWQTMRRYSNNKLKQNWKNLKTIKMKTETSYKSFKDLINSNWLNDRAESHLECWRDRYYRKSKRDISFDLSINHDNSLEIEMAEEDLGRKLTDKEEEYLINKFHKAVLNNLYKP